MSAASLYSQAVDVTRNGLAERQLLASVLLDAPSCIADGLDEVGLDLFTGTFTRAVWSEIAATRRRGEGIEFGLLGQRLSDRVDVLEFARLAEQVPSAANFATYLGELKQVASKRALVDGAHRVLMLGADKAPLEELHREATAALKRSEDAAASGGPRALRDILPGVVAKLGSPAVDRVPTGIRSLDDALAGLHPGELVILAARPSVGKTTLALNIAADVAKRGDGVLVVSLEMRAEELVSKLVAREGMFNPVAVRHDSPDATAAIAKAQEIAGRIAHLPLHFDDNSKSSLQQARAAIIRGAHATNARLVIIDYLGLLPPDERRATPYERTSAASREMKNLARTLGVPLLVLAQLNRDVERGGDNREPRLSDLRDSGTIEQDADVVILLSRKGERADGLLVDAHIAKNRNGPVGRVPLLFNAACSSFTDASLAFDFK